MNRFAAALAALLLAVLPAAAQQVELRTSLGTIVVELQPERAPKTVENFLQYVRDGFYRGTVFHRVMPGFMVQGGGFTPDMKQKPTRPPVPIESNNGLRNDVGTLAMARTPDPNSATAQFFINVVNNDGLNYPKPDGYGYTVFGRVVKGMDVVNRIAAVPTTARGPHRDVPVQPVVIEDARMLASSPPAQK